MHLQENNVACSDLCGCGDLCENTEMIPSDNISDENEFEDDEEEEEEDMDDDSAQLIIEN